MIKAGTSEKGCCAECGAPWRRVVEEKKLTRDRPNDFVKYVELSSEKKNKTPGQNLYAGFAQAEYERKQGVNSTPNSVAGVETKTVGWEPACECGAEVIPCTVLDCFIGSGTTCAVSLTLGRRSIGIDLSEKYLKNNAIPRIGGRLLSLGKSGLLKRKTVDISKFKKVNKH